MMIITAIIILYNQNQAVFEKLVDSLINQVDQIILVDNSDQNSYQETMWVWLNEYNNKKISYINLKGNYGIAYAQNKGIENARFLNSDFIILMDQDSIPPFNMVKTLVSTYVSLETEGIQVATVGPSFIDEKTLEKSKIVNYKLFHRTRIEPQHGEVLKADAIIASGSVIRLSIIDKIGLMRDELFIDAVDTEWCLRAKRLGYATSIDSSVSMKHNLGDSYFKFLKYKVLLHSDFRNYFIVRNNIYLILYSKLCINWKSNQFIKTLAYVGFYSLLSNRPFYSFILLNRALIDGIFKNMGKGYFRDK